MSFIRLWVEASREGREERLSCSSFREERLWPTHLSIVRSDWVGSDHDQVLVRLFFRLKMDLCMVTR